MLENLLIKLILKGVGKGDKTPKILSGPFLNYSVQNLVTFTIHVYECNDPSDL